MHASRLNRVQHGSTCRVLRALATVAATLVSSSVWADVASDRTQLTSCVDQHITTADQALVRRLTVITLFPASSANDPPVDEDLQPLMKKRDTIVADTAALITRIVRQDCKSEAQSLVADKVPGGAFGTIFSQLAASLQGVTRRGGVAVGLEILKKLDSSVTLDLGIVPESGAPPQAAAPARSNGPKTINLTAASGVRLQLAFEAALNPDCSPIGETVVRIVTPPAHGTVAVESGKGFSSYASTNQRYHCNEKPSRGKFVYYKSNQGYTGSDTLTFQVIYATGASQQDIVNISIN
jgi:hypothetical protein